VGSISDRKLNEHPSADHDNAGPPACKAALDHSRVHMHDRGTWALTSSG
jgi:hypothetical protein